MDNSVVVSFRALNDGTVVALTGNHDAIAVNCDKVSEYMYEMLRITKGKNVEFNDTFRQLCNGNVFYTFNPVTSYIEALASDKSMVRECVLLSNDNVAMNINNTIVILHPEDGNILYATKEDAMEAFKENISEVISKRLGVLFEMRKKMKQELAKYNATIDKLLNFKKSL